MKKQISLALQGGGSHGAFTWGVLDYLLEDERLSIDAISGTSAGAMNAVALVHGMANGGRNEARKVLRRFWEAVGRSARLSPIRRSPIDVLLGNWSLEFSPGYALFDLMQRSVSPYQFNPFDINPLRELVDEIVDFDAVAACNSVDLFISATNVESGKVRIFRNREITLDAVMASACLPYLFKAVTIDGVPYWDGGYMGNPSLFPFNDRATCGDILIVQINPVIRRGTPTTAHEIMNRVNEISFNASLLKELRAIEFVDRLVSDGALDPDRYRRLRIHVVSGNDELHSAGASSKVNAEMAFLEKLFDLGRQDAAAWLDANFDAIGERSSVDLRAMFDGRSG